MCPAYLTPHWKVRDVKFCFVTFIQQKFILSESISDFNFWQLKLIVFFFFFYLNTKTRKYLRQDDDFINLYDDVIYSYFGLFLISCSHHKPKPNPTAYSINFQNFPRLFN